MDHHKLLLLLLILFFSTTVNQPNLISPHFCTGTHHTRHRREEARLIRFMESRNGSFQPVQTLCTINHHHHHRFIFFSSSFSSLVSEMKKKKKKRKLYTVMIFSLQFLVLQLLFHIFVLESQKILC